MGLRLMVARLPAGPRRRHALPRADALLSVLGVLGLKHLLLLSQPRILEGQIVCFPLGDGLRPVVCIHGRLELSLSAPIVDLKLLDPQLHLFMLELLLAFDKLHLEFTGRRLTLNLLDNARDLLCKLQAGGYFPQCVRRCTLQDRYYVSRWASALCPFWRRSGLDRGLG